MRNVRLSQPCMRHLIAYSVRHHIRVVSHLRVLGSNPSLVTTFVGHPIHIQSGHGLPPSQSSCPSFTFDGSSPIGPETSETREKRVSLPDCSYRFENQVAQTTTRKFFLSTFLSKKFKTLLSPHSLDLLDAHPIKDAWQKAIKRTIPCR
ncbi:hypothetical protein CROQUDRAFT_100918 [Cronartium quercuum f. sp. fusiforme G11]|uniref:Uncharacterized protein n=1 Tax=Cronartium quercuum f. sp. fusiforme G11 TaxID=708437 RepID=A0A9P6N5R9_9BASI|nr:hypothetical protein CROQUDRAFT_100918 [Cronartium quercuum f. sp. fusiforme G11]